MTISIDKGFKTRWDNKSLDSTITGSISRGMPPEQTSMPYAVYTVISDVVTLKTREGRYSEKVVQVDVYDDSDVDCGDLIESVKASFQNSDKATTNPFTSAAAGESIQEIELDSNPQVLQESENVYRGFCQFRIRYATNRVLVPS